MCIVKASGAVVCVMGHWRGREWSAWMGGLSLATQHNYMWIPCLSRRELALAAHANCLWLNCLWLGELKSAREFSSQRKLTRAKHSLPEYKALRILSGQMYNIVVNLG